MKYSNYNVVILGSGLAGLYLANKLSESEKFPDGILLVTKNELFSGSTSLAQGGIVSVIPELNKSDSIESHIKDTFKAGCGLNDLNAVKLVSETSALIAQELIRYGVEFDKNSKHGLNFTLEGAHSHPRILHAGGDSTGKVIEEALCKRIKSLNNVYVYQNTMGVKILTDENNVAHGIIVYDSLNDSYETVYSNKIILATGGIGQIYKNTTNPETSCADGIALAMDIGCEVDNMEFVQFHPTGLYCKNKRVIPLISESARGEGAKLVNTKGDYFAKRYHHLGDLAPRDIVARAIQEEIINSDAEFVNLDISQIGIEKFKQRFPTITSLCAQNNVDINSGLIPVIPVQHYFMGGIKVDLTSKTSVKNLYAIGECASTGLHGANRLASNSLLECAVFAHKLSEELLSDDCTTPKKHGEYIKNIIDKYIEIEGSTPCAKEKTVEFFNRLKETMSKYVGISRNEDGLMYALHCINKIDKEFSELENSSCRENFELMFAISVSRRIVKSALERRSSLGAHFRSDYVQKSQLTKERMYTYDKILAG